MVRSGYGSRWRNSYLHGSNRLHRHTYRAHEAVTVVVRLIVGSTLCGNYAVRGGRAGDRPRVQSIMPGKLRNVCFTLNNYTDAQIETIKEIDCNYMVFGEEIGESKTPHLQGYIEFPNSRSFASIKSDLYNAHIEARRGTAKQASDYCKKEDFEPYEKGEISNQGKRSDIVALYEKVKEGVPDIELQDALPSAYMKYYKAVDRVRINISREDKVWKPVKVTVLVGPTGVGKSRKAREIDPDLYNVSYGEKLWWDGYDGQKTILLDDFYGWIRYGHLLNLLDGYPFNLPIKGGFT